MYDPTFQRFSSAYDQAELTVDASSIRTPQISQPFIEDLRYWTAGVESDQTGETIFVRTPEMDGHIRAELNADVPMETLLLPEPTLRDLGMQNVPVQRSFWIARPGHAEQLERFYV